jgi:hypothetical protein
VLEGQEINDPWQVPNWNELSQDAKDCIIKFRRNLGKKAFNNLSETKKIAAVNPEANDDTSDEDQD